MKSAAAWTRKSLLRSDERPAKSRQFTAVIVEREGKGSMGSLAGGMHSARSKNNVVNGNGNGESREMFAA